MLLMQLDFLAFSRTFEITGNITAARIVMTAITTSNSSNVKPDFSQCPFKAVSFV